jgi:biotin carboxylase
MLNKKVLVVGTTVDYIDIICKRFPDRALFLTDPIERQNSDGFYRPNDASEILCELSNQNSVFKALLKHIHRWGIEISGIACFDCESLLLASYLANKFSLPFPTHNAVTASRSKFISKYLWQKDNISCPRVQLVKNPDEAVSFMDLLNKPIVMKPLTGSGSELVFLCNNKEDCYNAFYTLKERIKNHRDNRMYAILDINEERINPRDVFVVEELISGVEYSCDFVINENNLEIIRIARKIPAQEQTIGTILAYILPAELPGEIDMLNFKQQLKRVANALGIKRAICMLDFIVEDDKIKMIEIAPRPGGDCLPFLEKWSSGFDVIGYTLNFAAGILVKFPPKSNWNQLVGLRLFANKGGTIHSIEFDEILDDSRVLECYIKHGVGHNVILPPGDYDSRILGHVIFKPKSFETIEEECKELSNKIVVKIK